MLNRIKLGKSNKALFRGKTSEFLTESKERTKKDDENIAMLNSWESALGSSYSIIHTISSGGGVSPRLRTSESPLFSDSVEAIFSGWDVISTSIIDYRRELFSVNNTKGRGALPIHLDLSVPVQNIMGTHIHDVSFPNHAGKENNYPGGDLIDRFALADAIFSGTTKKGRSLGRGYNSLLYFNQFKDGMNLKRYSEVLVIGRPGVSLYHGKPPTAEIKLKKLRYFPAELITRHVDADFKREVEADVQSLIKLARVNRVRTFSFDLRHLNRYSKSIGYIDDVFCDMFNCGDLAFKYSNFNIFRIS